MSAGRDPFKRHKTRHPGISYRVRADGSRAYYVYAKDVNTLSMAARPKRSPCKPTCAEASPRQPRHGEQGQARGARPGWLDSKNKLRDGTLTDYQADLENVILPRFGHLKPPRSPPTGRRVHPRPRQPGLSGARIQNILKPFNGTLDLAYAAD